MPNTDAAIKELLDALKTVTTELKDRTVGKPPKHEPGDREEGEAPAEIRRARAHREASRPPLDQG
jgi:hypothetical protein